LRLGPKKKNESVSRLSRREENDINKESPSTTTDVKENHLKKSAINKNSLSTITKPTINPNLEAIKRDKEEEFLLQDENNRFVLFPIRYHDM